MKKFSQICVALLLLMSCVMFSCTKSKSDPDPLPDKLVSITGWMGGIQYDDHDRRSYIVGFTKDFYSTTYKYDAAGNVSTISLFDGYGGSLVQWYDYKINYAGGLPVNGTRANHAESGKSPATTYSVDSILYKTENGHVTEITYLDRKAYFVSTNKPTGYVAPGIIKTFLISYANGNLTRMHSDYETFTYTYGVKKGAGSANRMKFVLFEGENALLYSMNDMLTMYHEIHDQWGNSKNSSIYTHEYNTSGYPAVTTSTATLSNGQISTTNFTYKYE